ncbi:MAG: tRNA preQ1(34) S-adenosylmethionine ribosyltransferase-isomerase QueA [Proteobacteria bacterium]|nr:tRNA preQ1(34) S-adenosylmethionine ribosyltransferase-isomerase QueA [Pseudomonadota bacterium]MBU1736557.1 tRNA preQ1(34) S-adenosylmethionine ribosyltransferase-isomerase QueA [Pseudomonadota bacterium]
MRGAVTLKVPFHISAGDLLFDLDDYDYYLPPAQIAQKPAAERDESRLLVMERSTGDLHDRSFSDLADLFRAGDLLVVNDTRVFPARLEGKKESGGRVELFILGYPLLLEQTVAGAGMVQAELVGLVKSSKRPRPGTRLLFAGDLSGEVLECLGDGKVRVVLSFSGSLEDSLARQGRIPLPPYIRRESGDEGFDRERYQTVYATKTGAVAAPTAGLHFTDELLGRLADKGVRKTAITLHVGYGTFAPVRVSDIREHRIHKEFLSVSAEAAAAVNETRAAGGRVWAVGTTTVRALESVAVRPGVVRAWEGDCGLYIYPGYQFKVVDNLITNFHLPKSSLLFLVSALTGKEALMAAYTHAVEKGYRFYSYGDAMAIVAGK